MNRGRRMAATQAPQTESTHKRGRMAWLIAPVLALGLGGAGFYAAYSGLLFKPQQGEGLAPLPGIAFVPIEPMIVSLGSEGRNRHLRFNAQLEVPVAHQGDVTLLLPRIMDVLNGYLRAVEIRDLEDPAALIRLRAQMLRRVQIVTGEGRVRDLLVTEFVVN